MSRSLAGFLEYLGAGVALNNVTHTAVELDVNPAEDRSRGIPAEGAALSHAELVATGAGSTASLSVHFTWDEEGDDIAAGPYTGTLAPLVTANREGVVINLEDLDLAETEDQTDARRLWAWVKSDAGTPTLVTCRLFWRSEKG